MNIKIDEELRSKIRKLGAEEIRGFIYYMKGFYGITDKELKELYNTYILRR